VNNNLLVDATPACDQLRDLATGGFPAVWIADRIGVSRNSIIAIRGGRRARIHPYTAAAIARLHDRLADTNPADHGVTKHGTTVSQWLPLTRGWAA
jgi:hypothetical protein